MSRLYPLLFILLPASVFSNSIDIDSLMEVDIVVSLQSENSKEAFTIDMVKYTLNGKGVDIRLKGWDGEILATLIPHIMEDGSITLTAECRVFDTDQELIKTSSLERITEFGESMLFYPLGQKSSSYDLTMEITLKKYRG